MQVKRILFPTDFSRCAEQALAQATFLARTFDAEIHLLHAIVLYNPADYLRTVRGMEQLYEQLHKSANKHMTDAIRKLKIDRTRVVRVISPAISASSFILGYAEKYEIDLIVMGTHGRRGLGHMLLGSIAEEVVRLAPCPVFTVRELEVTRPAGSIERILVPVDFSEPSRQALSCARALAAIYGAHLQLLHVIEQPLYPNFYAFETVAQPARPPDLEVTARQEIAKLMKETRGPDVPVEIHVIHGRAAQDINRFADNHSSDLIVIATHGLTGIKHMLMGSVTEKVVRMANCPVYTLKSYIASETEPVAKLSAPAL